jgi:histidinol-phosphatase (PHP family)
MLVDYHIHTSFSQDSTAPMQAQCEAAIARGIREIAFTEHEDYNPRDPTSFYFDHAAFWRELERCRALFAGKIVIRAGIEISEPHRYPSLAANVLSRFKWDFVLGSLHWLSPTVNCFLPEFFAHVNDWRESMRLYFIETIELARHGDFDVLAHIDYPVRYNVDAYNGEYDIRAYEPIVKDVLRAIIARDKGIEINMSATRAGRNPNPAPVVVEWFKQLGGKHLTIGTDSHTPAHTGLGIDTALAIARDAGWKQIATYELRRPVLVQLADGR